MKDFIELAWKDIKKRKNLELYVVLLAIVSVFVVSIFGVDTASTLVNITLAVLAVLLYGLIDTKHSAEKNQAHKPLPFLSLLFIEAERK